MKNLLLSFISALLVSLNVTAKDNVAAAPKLEVEVLDNLYFKVKVGSELVKGTVSLKNNEGETLHKDYLNETGSYVKVFDLKNLPDGDYTFEVRQHGKSTIHSFTIGTSVKRTVSQK